MPSQPPYQPILRRVGVVLVLVGVLDVAFMIYAIMHDISYSYSLNIFAIIAGGFLIRGSLRATSLIRRFAALFLAAGICILPLFPLLIPLDLILTSVRLQPMTFVTEGVIAVLTVAILYWVVTQLGRSPVQEAFVNAGLKRPDIRAAILAGMAIAVSVCGLVELLMHGPAPDHAKLIAEQRVGPGYRFNVSSIHMNEVNGVTSYSAVVTAWNEHEIKSIPVHWVQ